MCLAIPRTGSMALAGCLHGWFPTAVCAGHHRMDVPPRYQKFFVFSVVRNPYARILSYYRHRRRTERVVSGWTFGDYIRTTVNQEFPAVKLNNDRRCVDYPQGHYECKMFKLENMAVWWPTLPFWDERGAPPMPRGNESRQDFGGGFNEELAGIVYEYFKPDFDRFGYDRDSWRSVKVST